MARDVIITALNQRDVLLGADPYRAQIIQQSQKGVAIVAGTSLIANVYFEANLRAQYSEDGFDDSWHSEPTENDNFLRLSLDGGETWQSAWYLRGADGEPSEPIELQKSETHIQWKYESEGGESWRDLVALSEISGEMGDVDGGVF